jgi:hypothetical protein
LQLDQPQIIILNSLQALPLAFVAHSLQISLDMRLIRVSPDAQNPARLNLILKAHWNEHHPNQFFDCQLVRNTIARSPNCSGLTGEIRFSVHAVRKKNHSIHCAIMENAEDEWPGWYRTLPLPES